LPVLVNKAIGLNIIVFLPRPPMQLCFA